MYTGSEYNGMVEWAAHAAAGRVGAATCAMGRAPLQWIECDVSPRREGEEEMKRILAVLAMVVALSIPAAAHAQQPGPGTSHGKCAPHCAGKP
jgi:hypothetical protein